MSLNHFGAVTVVRWEHRNREVTSSNPSIISDVLILAQRILTGKLQYFITSKIECLVLWRSSGESAS